VRAHHRRRMAGPTTEPTAAHKGKVSPRSLRFLHVPVDYSQARRLRSMRLPMALESEVIAVPKSSRQMERTSA